MILHLLATLFLPTLLLAAPTTVSARQSACTPTSYTISAFSADIYAPDTSVHFSFKSTFSDPSIIVDPASEGATCEAKSDANGNFPSSSVCSTGANNLQFSLRGDPTAPVLATSYQIIHTWKCDGRTWMSSTPANIAPNCRDQEVCDSPPQVFAPENVRQVCGTPTCP